MSIAFVTGGTGFIGSHTVQRLIDRGIKVRCLVRPSRNNLQWIRDLPVEKVFGDLLAPDSLKTAIQGVDYIIHIAGVTKAKRKREFFEGNVVATQRILELASKVPNLKKFCYVSSLTAVGPSPQGIALEENAPCNPISAYGVSKLEAERMCLSYQSSIPLVIIRPPAVYGPRDQDVLEMFKAAKFRVEPIIGIKAKSLSIIYGPDLAEAIIQTILHPDSTGKTYFVSDGVAHIQSELFHQVSFLVGRRSLKVRIPASLVYTLAAVTEIASLFGTRPAILSIDKARDLLQAHWVCSSEKIKREIGFEAKTPPEEGLRTTYEWYRSNGWL